MLLNEVSAELIYLAKLQTPLWKMVLVRKIVATSVKRSHRARENSPGCLLRADRRLWNAKGKLTGFWRHLVVRFARDDFVASIMTPSDLLLDFVGNLAEPLLCAFRFITIMLDLRL